MHKQNIKMSSLQLSSLVPLASLIIPELLKFSKPFGSPPPLVPANDYIHPENLGMIDFTPCVANYAILDDQEWFIAIFAPIKSMIMERS